MGRKRFPSDRSEQCRSKALGFGNYPSAVSTRSSSFLSRNLQLRHPGPRGDLGVHGQLSTAEPCFQRLLLALPCLGTWLGTAWEPAGGFTSPRWGFAAKRDGRRDALQSKGELGACPHLWAQGLSQK